MPASSRRRELARIAPAVLLALVVLLIASAAVVDAFLFPLPSGTERCITQEVPSDTEVKLTYSADEAYGDFLDVIMTDSDGAPVYQETAKTSGYFSDHLTRGGEYTLCFTSRQSRKSKKLPYNVLLSLQIGADAKDYTKLATKDKMRPMEVQMRVMEDTVAEVHNEFIYFKQREAEMRSTNEHMTAMVMWMSVGLILLFAAFSYLQMRHLKFYFKKKRMID